jgi:hypothetical protein
MLIDDKNRVFSGLAKLSRGAIAYAVVGARDRRCKNHRYGSKPPCTGHWKIFRQQGSLCL